MNARTAQILAMLTGCLLLVAPAVGQVLQNGTFDTDVSSWIVKGAVTHLDDGFNDGFVMFEELGDGARSRIYQDIPISSGQNYLSFRYRLSSAPVGRTIAVPPDSFAAKLIDPDTGERVVVPLFCDPLFGQSYFYTDSDGQKIYHDPYVSVTGPDAEGMFTVVLNNLFTAVGETVRVEFGLASTDNGVSTFAVLDDVVVGCPPGFCCGPPDIVNPIDDGDPCTDDVCDSMTGFVTHTFNSQTCTPCADDCNANGITDDCENCFTRRIKLDGLFGVGELVDMVTEQTGDCLDPTMVWAVNPMLGSGVNAAVVIDSSAPPANNFHLGSPNSDFSYGGGPGPGVGAGGIGAGSFPNGPDSLEDILIVNETVTDSNMDGDVDTPDDAAAGGTIELDFSLIADGAVEIWEMKALSIDNDNSYVDFYDANDAHIGHTDIPNTGVNGVVWFKKDDPVYKFGNSTPVHDGVTGVISGVQRMVVTLAGEGAIDDIRYRPDFCKKLENETTRCLLACVDCNGNGIPDGIDLDPQQGTSIDCNGDQIPDECGVDCDGSGDSDVTEICGDATLDLNNNGILDVCEFDGTVTVHLQIDGITTATTRQTEFAFATCSSLPPQVKTIDVAYDATGSATVVFDDVNPDSRYLSVKACSTLRRVIELFWFISTPPQVVASFDNGNNCDSSQSVCVNSTIALIQGDVTGAGPMNQPDNVIDDLDRNLISSQFGQTTPPTPPPGECPMYGDLDGDSDVDSDDLLIVPASMVAGGPSDHCGSMSSMFMASEADCNSNGLDDYIDVSGGTSADCDTNGIPDECGGFVDVNTNAVPDLCEMPKLNWIKMQVSHGNVVNGLVLETYSPDSIVPFPDHQLKIAMQWTGPALNTNGTNMTVADFGISSGTATSLIGFGGFKTLTVSNTSDDEPFVLNFTAQSATGIEKAFSFCWRRAAGDADQDGIVESTGSDLDLCLPLNGSSGAAQLTCDLDKDNIIEWAAPTSDDLDIAVANEGHTVGPCP